MESDDESLKTAIEGYCFEYDAYPFTYMVDEVEASTKNEIEQEDKLTAKILDELFMFHGNVSSSLSSSSSSSSTFYSNENDKFGDIIPKKNRGGGTKRKRVLGECFQNNHERNNINKNSVTQPKRCVPIIVNDVPEEKNDVGMSHQLSKKQMQISEEVTWPSVLKRTIEEKRGYEVTLLLRKKLTATDLAKGNNRVSLPINQMKNSEFLRDHEKRDLDERDGKQLKGVNVKFIGPSESDDRKGIELQLKKWGMKKSIVYNLVGGWYKDVVCKNIELQINIPVQFWSFRSNNDQLWIQLVIEKDDDQLGDRAYRCSINGDHQTSA